MQKQNKFKQKFTKYDISISLTIKLATDADNVTASIGLLDATFRCNCSTLFVQSLNCFCNTSKLADADANASDIQPNGLALITETKKVKRKFSHAFSKSLKISITIIIITFSASLFSTPKIV